MTMKAVERYLKNNIPEFQENSETLQAYLGVMGGFLDALKERIEEFDHIKDYEVIGFGGLNNRLRERGNDLPRALPLDFKRRWYRDIADHKAKFGTEASIKHAFSSIGVNADYRDAWLLSPELMRDGKYRNPETGEVEEYPVDASLTGSFRTNFVYGKPVVTDEGTFLEGYDYLDVDKERPKIYHIMGETYDNPINKSVQFVAAKTPYIILKFEREYFNINTGKYVDPLTGETYEYSDIEENLLMEEIIRFFSLGENRPTTIKILLIVVDRFDDEFLVTDEVWEENFIALSKFYPVYVDDAAVFKELRPVGVGGHWEDEELNLEEDFDQTIPQVEDIFDDHDVSLTDEVVEENFYALSRAYGVKVEEIPVYVGDMEAVVGGHWEDEPIDMQDSIAPVVSYSPEWDEVEGKPNSDIEDIDDIVVKKHSHSQPSVLDKLGDENGVLTFGGKIAGIHWLSTEW